MEDINFDQIQEVLSKPLNIAVTSHFNPDGDALGSALAVYHIMRLLNHKVHTIIPNAFPDFLKWMPGSSDIIIFESEQQAEAREKLVAADVIFCLDYNAAHRTGKMEEVLKIAPGKKILIDHHPNPDTEFFDFLLSDVTASSTAELCYRFFNETGILEYLNKDVAECLYTGIITDTGSFSFSCNSPATYRIVAHLVEEGIDAVNLHKLIYDTSSEGRVRLLGYSIYEKMVVLPEFRTAYIVLTKEDLENFNYNVGDTEGIVNFPLSIKEINLAILITERNDLVRLSFRSKGEFPANEIAQKYFEGGGHRNAAGGNSHQPVDATISKLESILPEYSERLNFMIS